MKAVIIGSYGHYEYALGGKIPVEFTAVAAGADGEPLDRLLSNLSKLGQTPKVYLNAAEMLEKEKPDVAVINTQMNLNAGYSVEAMKRGISVFCEKPSATEMGGLAEVIQMYNNAKFLAPQGKTLVYAPMFGITCEPWFEAARQAIKSGMIGEVRLASAQKSYKLGTREPFYSQRKLLGGLIPWVSIHGIDWLYSVCGMRFRQVFASQSREANGGNGELEATASCQFECDNGAIATVTADYLRPKAAKTHGDDRLRAVGTKGIIEVRGEKTYVIDCDGERELAPMAPDTGLFDSMLLEMCGKGKCRADAENAFYVTRAALLARESADENKIVKF